MSVERPMQNPREVDIRPVETRHLSQTIHDLGRLWPLEGGRPVLRARVQVSGGALKDELSERLLLH